MTQTVNEVTGFGRFKETAEFGVPGDATEFIKLPFAESVYGPNALLQNIDCVPI